MAEKFTNEWFSDLAQKALSERLDWERRIARARLQRYCEDRAKQNNSPWPRASNFRWPYSDTKIRKIKAIFFKVLYASETLAHFKSLVQKNIPMAAGCGYYFDFLVKEKTDFEVEVQFAIDCTLVNGEVYLKTTWNKAKQCPVFTMIDPLFVINPSTATVFKNTPWWIHVMQFHPDEVKRRWPDVDLGDLKDMEDDPYGKQSDQTNAEQDEYRREGINRTGKEGKLVIWEVHYTDAKGNKRLRTMSPDRPTVNFKDDRAYTYDHGEWMAVQHRYEITNKKLHSSRGICEITEEVEHTLSAVVRAWQNDATLRNNPIYNAPDAPTGSTNNMPLRPGQISPVKLEIVNQGAPPMSWDEEIQRQLSIGEQQISTPDFGLRNSDEKKERTAKEISFIQGVTSLEADVDIGNWKAFIRSALRQAWALVVQYKPDSLSYYVNEDMKDLDPAALNNDYLITVSGSAESINREWMLKKAEVILETCAKYQPFGNVGEAVKYLFEQVVPGQWQRFYRDPQAAQAHDMNKALSDLNILKGLEVDPRMLIQPSDNDVVCAQAAMQLLDALRAKGGQVEPTQVERIGQYIALHREALKKKNPQAYEQLTQALDQMDQKNRQHAQAIINHGVDPVRNRTARPGAAPSAPAAANTAMQPELATAQ